VTKEQLDEVILRKQGSEPVSRSLYFLIKGKAEKVGNFQPEEDAPAFPSLEYNRKTFKSVQNDYEISKKASNKLQEIEEEPEEGDFEELRKKQT